MTTPHRTPDLAAFGVDAPSSVIRLQTSSTFACEIGKSASMRRQSRRLTGSQLRTCPALTSVASAMHADLVVVGRSAKMRHRRAGSLGRRLVGRKDAPVVVVVP
jgi:hypothetical protein